MPKVSDVLRRCSATLGSFGAFALTASCMGGKGLDTPRPGGATDVVSPSPRPVDNLYSRCRNHLGPTALDPRRWQTLIDDFVAATGTKHLRLNGEFAPDQFNLLLPDPDTPDDQWPARECGVGPWPPNCKAEATSGSIVCNPAMAARLAGSSLYPPSSLATIYAERFVAYFVLGHELAHLRRHDDGTHAALPDAARDLKCRPPVQRSVEMECDEAGILDATKGIRGLGLDQALIEGLSSPLELVSPLEVTLDHHWFSIDDTCVGDASYPSMMRRKYRLRRAYLDALEDMVGSVGLLGALHSEEVKDYLAFEELLRGNAESEESGVASRPHQVHGFASTPRYGTGWADEQGVLWSEVLGGFISFDDGSARSDSQRGAVVYFGASTEPLESGTLALAVVHDFGGGVDLLGMSNTQDGVEIVVRQAEASSSFLTRLLVTKPSGEVVARTDRLAVADDDRIVSGKHGWLARVDADRVELFESIAALRGSRPAAGHRRQLAPQPQELIVLGDGRLTIANSPEVPGLFVADVFTRSSAVNVAFAIPERAGFAGGETPALGVVGSRLVVAQQDDQNSALHILTCPSESLSRASRYDCELRHVKQWSGLAPAYITRDIAALSPAILTAPPSCGAESVELRIRGLTWLFDPDHGDAELFPGSGLAACHSKRPFAWTWRARRVDVLRRTFRQSAAESVPIDVGVTPI